MLDQFICPNCGAALPASATTLEVVTCQYCSVTFRIPHSFTPEPDMGNLILGADFRQQPIAGWDFPNKDDVHMISGTRPELRFKFAPKSGMFYALNSSGLLDNFDVSVSLTFYEGDVKQIDAGFAIRYRKGIGSYIVLISACGTYCLAYYDKGADGNLAWNDIMKWTAHSALRSGLNQSNRLRVIANGDHLRIYINGVLATAMHDKHYDIGEVILAAESTEKSSIDVGFADLQVREVKL